MALIRGSSRTRSSSRHAGSIVLNEIRRLAIFKKKACERMRRVHRIRQRKLNQLKLLLRRKQHEEEMRLKKKEKEQKKLSRKLLGKLKLELEADLAGGRILLDKKKTERKEIRKRIDKLKKLIRKSPKTFSQFKSYIRRCELAFSGVLPLEQVLQKSSERALGRRNSYELPLTRDSLECVRMFRKKKVPPTKALRLPIPGPYSVPSIPLTRHGQQPATHKTKVRTLDLPDLQQENESETKVLLSPQKIERKIRIQKNDIVKIFSPSRSQKLKVKRKQKTESMPISDASTGPKDGSVLLKLRGELRKDSRMMRRLKTSLKKKIKRAQNVDHRKSASLKGSRSQQSGRKTPTSKKRRSRSRSKMGRRGRSRIRDKKKRKQGSPTISELPISSEQSKGSQILAPKESHHNKHSKGSQIWAHKKSHHPKEGQDSQILPPKKSHHPKQSHGSKILAPKKPPKSHPKKSDSIRTSTASFSRKRASSLSMSTSRMRNSIRVAKSKRLSETSEMGLRYRKVEVGSPSDSRSTIPEELAEEDNESGDMYSLASIRNRMGPRLTKSMLSFLSENSELFIDDTEDDFLDDWFLDLDDMARNLDVGLESHNNWAPEGFKTEIVSVENSDSSEKDINMVGRHSADLKYPKFLAPIDQTGRVLQLGFHSDRDPETAKTPGRLIEDLASGALDKDLVALAGAKSTGLKRVYEVLMQEKLPNDRNDLGLLYQYLKDYLPMLDKLHQNRIAQCATPYAKVLTDADYEDTRRSMTARMHYIQHAQRSLNPAALYSGIEVKEKLPDFLYNTDSILSRWTQHFQSKQKTKIELELEERRKLKQEEKLKRLQERRAAARSRSRARRKSLRSLSRCLHHSRPRKTAREQKVAEIMHSPPLKEPEPTVCDCGLSDCGSYHEPTDTDLALSNLLDLADVCRNLRSS